MIQLKNTSLLVIYIATLTTSAFAQNTPGKFALDGKITGEAPPKLYLYYTNSKNKPVRDSTMLTDGSFSFKGEITEPTMAYMMPKKSGSESELQLFLEPAIMHITIDGHDFKNPVMAGSATQKEWELLSTQKAGITKEMEPLTNSFSTAAAALNKAKKEKASEEELARLEHIVDSIRDAFEPYNARMSGEDMIFFDKHPESLVTAFYLRYYVSRLPVDSLKLFYKRLGSKVQKMNYGKEIGDEISKLDAGSPGHVAKNFQATTMEGKPLQLSDFKGKYVLLDFWASWCVPCRKGNPHLKELYTRYKQKGFEVIGVSDDDSNNEAWKKAVEKDELPWQHVLRGLKYDKEKGYDKTNDISELYGIHTLPTQILVNPVGKIIGRYGGGGMPHEALDDKLASVFK